MASRPRAPLTRTAKKRARGALFGLHASRPRHNGDIFPVFSFFFCSHTWPQWGKSGGAREVLCGLGGGSGAYAAAGGGGRDAISVIRRGLRN